jgi:hypothetical protein
VGGGRIQAQRQTLAKVPEAVHGQIICQKPESGFSVLDSGFVFHGVDHAGTPPLQTNSLGEPLAEEATRRLKQRHWLFIGGVP